jgi:hypothetical protein
MPFPLNDLEVRDAISIPAALTAEVRNQRLGFVEDALVVVFVGGDDIVGAEIFLGVDKRGEKRGDGQFGKEQVKNRSL